MKAKLIGGILLIVGNAIGGGMLALPLATAQAGFINSTLFLVLCWAIMVAGALLILEVNLWFPANSNLISMARATLGKPGEIIAWISYFLLLYSLLAAYTGGGSDFLRGLLQKAHLNIPPWLGAILFITIFGSIVYRGIRSVDYVNRGLMGTKLGVYLLLIFLILPFISSSKLEAGSIKYLPDSLTVMITSFGFAAIVPSLRSYFHSNVKQLRLAIIIGSLIPLVCYILWNLAIMGMIPVSGDNGLVAIAHSDRANSNLTNALSVLLNKNIVTIFAWLFTSICLATSFLGVGLSLADFLADGFGINKEGKGNIIIHAATFVPPLIIVLFFPAIFILALSYAGIWCATLLALLPALMAWGGRYKKNLANGYQVQGGKPLLAFVIVSSLIIIIHALVSNLH